MSDLRRELSRAFSLSKAREDELRAENERLRSELAQLRASAYGRALDLVWLGEELRLVARTERERQLEGDDTNRRGG